MDDLCRHNFKPILAGRDGAKLSILGKKHQDLLAMVADINQPDELDNVIALGDVVINCAGPYLDTAEPIIQSALRMKKHYIDLSAEQKAVLDVYEKFAKPAAEAGISIIPAAAFYG